jgi:hypothetical protein
MHCCERFTDLSLLLLPQCNQTIDSQRKSQPAYQEQHGESPREEELICNSMLFGLWGARLQPNLSSFAVCAVDTREKANMMCWILVMAVDFTSSTRYHETVSVSLPRFLIHLVVSANQVGLSTRESRECMGSAGEQEAGPLWIYSKRLYTLWSQAPFELLSSGYKGFCKTNQINTER